MEIGTMYGEGQRYDRPLVVTDRGRNDIAERYLASKRNRVMKQINGIHHIGLRVRSLEAARAFYEQLGFEFIVGPIGPEPVAVMEHPSGININFILNANTDASTSNVLMDLPEKHPGFNHIALEIDDPGMVQQQLAAREIPITEIVERPNGAIFFFVRDQDGNVIEFHKPANQI
jgi:lactoylglutathione lyase